ncbi:MAG: DUF4185 domain-containing protein [candidate division KSB1 bacterium]|nr:DUF4185 domain-containing protein [candidate division KSB1 bacterium]
MSRDFQVAVDVSPMPELERLFRMGTEGWLGGDCAFSTPLDGQRILWLFGDSFVSDNPQVGTRRGARLVANSIAVQREGNVRFYWKQGQEGPDAFFGSGSVPGRCWPLSAARVGAELAVFAVRVVTIDPDQVTGFRIVGHEVHWVRNPDDDPRHWEIEVKVLPWAEKTGTFGSWLLAQGEHLYIYGFRRRFRTWFREVHMVVARAPMGAVADPNKWEYLDGARGTWSRRPEELRPVLKDGATEFSVSYLPALGKFILVSGSWGRGYPLRLRVAETPYGPFSPGQTLYRCPEASRNRRYFCYAAKAHPELATEGSELVVSYAVNSRRFDDCFTDQDIYYPRFLRVKVDSIGKRGQ